MKMWPVAWLLLAGCERVFGFDVPIVPDAAIDAAIDAPLDPPRLCTAPFQLGAMEIFNGAFADFTPSADESFAVVTALPNRALGVTLNDSNGLGTSVQPIATAAQVGRASLSPDGLTVYLHVPAGGVGATVQMSSQSTAGAHDWSPPIATQLPDALPGRPARDGRMMIEVGGQVSEWLPIDFGWSQQGPLYTAASFGHSAAGFLSHANLSEDGLVLLYVLGEGTASGVYYRQRSSLASTFMAGSSIGGLILPGAHDQYRSPTLTADCSRLFVTDAGKPVVFTLR